MPLGANGPLEATGGGRLWWADVLSTILAQCVDTLDVPPERVHLAPGAVVSWDSGCGQAWARLGEVTPWWMGDQARNHTGCGPAGWDALVHVGVMRCVTALDGGGRVPAPQVVTSDAASIVEDAERLAGVLQRLDLPAVVVSYRVVRWSPLGPEGGTAGGEWSLALRLQHC